MNSHPEGRPGQDKDGGSQDHSPGLPALDDTVLGDTVLDDIARPLDRFGRILATASLLFMVIFAAAMVLTSASSETGGTGRQFDFVAFWGAAKLALAGHGALAFDAPVLRAIQDLPPDASEGDLRWFYPPAVEFLFIPFALMPFALAWLSFNLISIGLFVRTLRDRAAAVPMGEALMIGAPAVIIVFRLGQMALLWAAGLLAALTALERGRAVTAGVLIGLLTLKPQLGLLIPVVLVARGEWRVILWASLTALALCLVPTPLVGIEYWSAFLRSLQAVTAWLGTDWFAQRNIMVSFYAFLRLVGAGHDLAFQGQLVVTLGLAAGLAMAWRRRTANAELRAGLLLVVIPLASHYAYFYETAICIPAAICLVRGGYGRATLDRVLLALVLFWPASFFVSTLLAPLMALIMLAIFLRALPLALGSSAGPERTLT